MLQLVPQYVQHVQNPAVSQLDQEVSKLFLRADMQAFRIMLCAAAAHTLQFRNLPPVWIMLIGPPGSFKTTLLHFFRKIPDYHWLDTLTPKTFISGYKSPKARERTSLLFEYGASFILAMEDFSTILSMRYDDQMEIMSQLRRVYDGEYGKKTGMGQPFTHWQGRATFLAACTPAIDAPKLAYKRELGDRFLDVRWNGVPGMELSSYLMNVSQHNLPGMALVQALVAELVSKTYKCPTMDSSTIEFLSRLCALTADARIVIYYDHHGNDIIDIGVPEQTSRITQTIMSVVLTNAALDGSSVVRTQDLRLAKRIAMDSIPAARRDLLLAIGLEGIDNTHPIFQGLSRYKRDRGIKELIELGLVEQMKKGAWYTYSDGISETMKDVIDLG